MKLLRATTFGFFTLNIFLASCQSEPYDGKLNNNKLIPFTATYTEGDDGLQIHILTIAENNGIFSAEEIMTDNYSVPKTFDTLKFVRLSDTQIVRTREFLLAASKLPRACDQVTSLTQKLSIAYNNKQIEVEGNCLWGKATYHNLRKLLFGKD